MVHSVTDGKANTPPLRSFYLAPSLCADSVVSYDGPDSRNLRSSILLGPPDPFITYAYTSAV